MTYSKTGRFIKLSEKSYQPRFTLAILYKECAWDICVDAIKSFEKFISSGTRGSKGFTAREPNL